MVIFTFTASGKLIILDEKYLHSTKKLSFCKYSISSVHQVSSNFFLVGSANGTLEALKVLMSHEVNISSTMYFFSQRKITQIRSFQSMTSGELYFAFRTDMDHLIVAKLNDDYPLRILNVDKKTIDVVLNEQVLPHRTPSY
jgi:hypothetical protein